MTLDIKSWLRQASHDLKPSSDSARLDAELLVCFVLQKPRSFVYSHPEYPLSPAEHSSLTSLLQKRQQGQPIAYLIGEKDFWSLRLTVNQHTLIPRADTERLVEVALDYLKQKSRPHILDLGTGSGAIALALASERADSVISAVDVSHNALKVAKDNAKTHQLDNVDFLCSDWFAALDKTGFDLIVSNPPYIAENDPHLTQSSLPYEPRLALTSAESGFYDFKAIAQQALAYLKPGGMLLFEHGYQQQAQLGELLSGLGYKTIQYYQDIAKNPRAISGISPQ